MTRNEFYKLYRDARINSKEIDVEYKLNGRSMKGFILSGASTECQVYVTSYLFSDMPTMFDNTAIEFADTTMLLVYASCIGDSIIDVRKKRIATKYPRV